MIVILGRPDLYKKYQTLNIVEVTKKHVNIPNVIERWATDIIFVDNNVSKYLKTGQDITQNIVHHKDN